MKKYFDKNYYFNEFTGKVIPDDEVEIYSQRATMYIDSVCDRNSIPDEKTAAANFKLAAAVIAEIIYKDENNLFIKSESVKSISVNYCRDNLNPEKLKINAVREYLSGLGVLSQIVN